MKKTKEQKNREILSELDLEGSMKTIFEEIDKIIMTSKEQDEFNDFLEYEKNKRTKE